MMMKAFGSSSIPVHASTIIMAAASFVSTHSFSILKMHFLTLQSSPSQSEAVERRVKQASIILPFKRKIEPNSTGSIDKITAAHQHFQEAFEKLKCSSTATDSTSPISASRPTSTIALPTATCTLAWPLQQIQGPTLATQLTWPPPVCPSTSSMVRLLKNSPRSRSSKIYGEG